MRHLYTIYALLAVALLWGNRDEDMGRMILHGAWIALWIAAVLLLFILPRRPWIALLPLVPLLGVLLPQLGERVSFVVEYQGLDCATCNGSPVAFAIGLSVELVLSILGIPIGVWLLQEQRRGAKTG